MRLLPETDRVWSYWTGQRGSAIGTNLTFLGHPFDSGRAAGPDTFLGPLPCWEVAGSGAGIFQNPPWAPWVGSVPGTWTAVREYWVGLDWTIGNVLTRLSHPSGRGRMASPV
jgi:hypothetical protein